MTSSYGTALAVDVQRVASVNSAENIKALERQIATLEDVTLNEHAYVTLVSL
ncbi:hypothetical protein ACGFY9_03580 [Streptomyces sp. NPDC048504]|uniref:hypothetical protein n=1 Tax=Streptomyces sp. NPDC048504 TaxID=3365559 RepID=UPI00371FA48D